MAVSTHLSGAGLRNLTVFALGSNGLPLASVAGATPYSGAKIDLAKAFSITAADPQVIQLLGDDRPQGQIILPPTELINGEIRTQKSNLTIDALLTGVNVVTTGDQVEMLRFTNLQGCEALIGLMAYQQAIDNDPDSAMRGATRWRALFSPKARIVPQGGPMEEGSALESTYMAYPQAVNAHLWGLVFTTGTEGATEGQLVERFFAGPPVIDTWLIDSTPTLALTLSQTAKADLAGTSFDIRVYHWVSSTGAVSDITAASTLAADTVTVVGAVEDDMIVAVYSDASGCGTA